MRFHDLVRGEVIFAEDVLDDFIILRSDGSPTYHLSVCCDDADSGVTHVIRGEDHLSNVPKHIGLFQALAAPVPVFGHLPLIMGPDRKRLSKRTGAASVEEFRDQGILPQALYNFLALLGWSPGDGREVMSRQEMIEAFTTERLVPSAAIFDVDKLRWMNAQHLSGEPLDLVLRHLEPFLEGAGLDGADPERLRTVVDLVRTRAYNLKEVADFATTYFQERLVYDDELCRKFLAQGDLPGQLDLLSERFQALPSFDLEGIEAAIRGLAEEVGVKAGVLIHPTRMALTASKAGPSLFHLVEAMGREDSIRHLGHFGAYLRNNAASG
jgi:glutamyl-tRNA synthetase